MNTPNARTILHVVGARPNVMKLGPLYRAVADAKLARQLVVHTGQHYDAALAPELFEDFKLPPPDHNLAVGTLSPAEQYGEVILRLSQILTAAQPDLVVTYGDVRSTPAAAIAAYHCGVPAAHYEGGLRAFNRVWAEEFHRVTADAYCELIFCTEPEAYANVVGERRSEAGVHLTGDLMCDAARMLSDHIDAGALRERHGLPERYAIFTAHHTNNVDARASLERTIETLARVAKRRFTLFPVHPRTMRRAEEHGLRERLESVPNTRLCAPLRYAEFIPLVKGAQVVAADSGSLAPECVFLGVPLLYLHPVIERPLALETGGVVLCDMKPERVERELERALAGEIRAAVPDIWRGHAAERIVEILNEYFEMKN